MTCENIHINSNKYFDKTLTENELKEFEEHLKECRACFRIFDSYNALFDEVTKISQTITPPPTLIKEILVELQDDEEKTEQELNEGNHDVEKVEKKGLFSSIKKKLKR